MNVVHLALLPPRHPSRGFTVAVHIDGEPLTELARRVEVSHRLAIGADHDRIRYTWVWAGVMLLPRLHLLGVSASPWCPGFSEVLVCTCGEAACGAIAVSVRVWPNHIGWHGVNSRRRRRPRCASSARCCLIVGSTRLS